MKMVKTHKPTGQFCRPYPMWIKTAEQKRRYEERNARTEKMDEDSIKIVLDSQDKKIAYTTATLRQEIKDGLKRFEDKVQDLEKELKITHQSINQRLEQIENALDELNEGYAWRNRKPKLY
jgi:predicted DNA-binding protein YlxM (UPF0122 family)